jgi:1-acyl-sn-glycerol-3-phosphate acyltransferase
MKKSRAWIFKPLPLLSPGRAFLLKALMLPNVLLTRASGLENLPKKEHACIYAFNHNNSLEALLVPVFLIHHLGGRTISFVIDWMYGKIPVIGRLMDMIDPIYVCNKRSTLPWIEKLRPPRSSFNTVEQCARKLLTGRSIGIFPEGTRNSDPEMLLKARPGIGHIALQAEVAVVPVGIDFTCRKARGKIPMLGRIIIRIGRPLHFPRESCAYRALSDNAHKERSRMAVEVTNEIMHCLAELSGKRYHEPPLQETAV